MPVTGTVVPSVPPTAVTIRTPAASPRHPNHFQAILAAIMAGLQAATPILVTILPPPAALAIEAGEALEPVVVSTVQAVASASSTTSSDTPSPATSAKPAPLTTGAK